MLGEHVEEDELCELGRGDGVVRGDELLKGGCTTQ